MATAKRIAMRQAQAREALEEQIADLEKRVEALEAALAQTQAEAKPAARKK